MAMKQLLERELLRIRQHNELEALNQARESTDAIPAVRGNNVSHDVECLNVDHGTMACTDTCTCIEALEQDVDYFEESSQEHVRQASQGSDEEGHELDTNLESLEFDLGCGRHP